MEENLKIVNSFFGINKDVENNETDWEFCLRCCLAKVNGDIDADWYEIVEQFGLKCHPDTLRKNFVGSMGVQHVAKYYKDKIVDMVVNSQPQQAQDELLMELEIKKRELYKERVKLQDLNNAIRRESRPQARWEVAMEKLEDSIMSLPSLTINLATDDKGSNEASILISDVHIGKGVNTPHNTYNLEIAKERLEKLATQVIHFAKLHQVGTLNIDFLGDLIENNMHLSSQVEQVCDLMEQVAYAGEYLSQFIVTLAPHFNSIRLHSVYGNHDRCEKDFKASRIDCENYVKLIDTFIELRTGLKFERSNVDTEIEVYQLGNGLKVALQHGHNVKNIGNLVKDTSFYLDMNIDFCHIGHFHHFESIKGTVCNGCVCGSDKYANKLRFNDKASQVLAVYYEDGTQVLHNIVLN